MKTKYSMVREYIEENIKNEVYKPNEKIESESELMKRFGVSRHTVRLAIGDLVTEGQLYREQGAGTFCSDQKQAERRPIDKIKKIAIITTYISDYIFPSIIRGAESYLSDKGYQVSLFSTNNSFDKEREILEKVLEQQFDGIIIEPTKSAFSNPNITYYLEMERLNIPFIMINEYYDVLEPAYVSVDDEAGGFLQAEYLIGHGHKNIVGLFKTDDMQGVKRLKGFLKAHRKHDIKISPSNIITYNTEEKNQKPAKLLQEILEENKKITAISCYNDELAMNILEVLRKQEIKVPEDLSIIGFDDSILANISEVKLTSILHPKALMGETAAKKILELVDESRHRKKLNTKIEPTIFECRVVERNSVKNINI